MKYKIIEIDRRDAITLGHMPLTYRIEIKITSDKDYIELKREYFNVGYDNNEYLDNMYFNNSLDIYTNILKATFITRNFDKKYLEQKEKELIAYFYDEISNHQNILILHINDQINIMNKKIKKLEETKKCDIFLKIFRENKLKSLK